jgi:2-keto-3-deoxy-6-phosphogluconate aldolase
LAVGGTWVARRPDIAAGQWDKIKANCRQIVGALEA